MFKNFFKRKEKIYDNKNILIAALLVHAAKIDNEYTDVEKKIISQALINLNLVKLNDVDKLLRSNIFSWVYLHLYSCQERIIQDFSHLKNRTSVMHNAAPRERFNFSAKKNIYAIISC